MKNAKSFLFRFFFCTISVALGMAIANRKTLNGLLGNFVKFHGLNRMNLNELDVL